MKALILSFTWLIPYEGAIIALYALIVAAFLPLALLIASIASFSEIAWSPKRISFIDLVLAQSLKNICLRLKSSAKRPDSKLSNLDDSSRFLLYFELSSKPYLTRVLISSSIFNSISIFLKSSYCEFKISIRLSLNCSGVIPILTNASSKVKSFLLAITSSCFLIVESNNVEELEDQEEIDQIIWEYTTKEGTWSKKELDIKDRDPELGKKVVINNL